MEQDKMCQSPPPPGPMDMQLHEQIKVLDRIKFPWKDTYQDRWNKAYDDLVKCRSIHSNSNVSWHITHLGKWVYNQRKSKKIYDASKKCGLTIEWIKKLNTLSFEWSLSP
jgi:hypothetical protein